MTQHYSRDVISGLADEPAVRNNEAYLSHYLDLQPLSDPTLGWAVFARQNQATGQGAHPRLALACQPGAIAFCTDGAQFFGPDHRLTGTPILTRADRLPSRRVQGEFAVAGLQSPEFNLAPGDAVDVSFIARYDPDHPEATGPGDLEGLRQLAASAIYRRLIDELDPQQNVEARANRAMLEIWWQSWLRALQLSDERNRGADAIPDRIASLRQIDANLGGTILRVQFERLFRKHKK